MNRLAILQRHLLSAGLPTPDQLVVLTPLSAFSTSHGVVIVGGMVLDLQAYPTTSDDVRRCGSVPGRVVQTPGGVARNVAESLAALCQSVAVKGPLLLSAVGDDLAAHVLLTHWRSIGGSTEGILQLPGRSTPTVVVVFDKSGEVAACVADVGLLEEALKPALLRQHSGALATAPVVMLDGNLSAAAIQAACALSASTGVPVWFEPVSAPKSVRAVAVLHLLAYISPNEAELVAMAEAVRLQQHRSGSSDTCRSCSSVVGSSSSPPSPPRDAGEAQRTAAGSAGDVPQPSSSGHGSIARLSPEVASALQPLHPHIRTLLQAGVKHIMLTLGPLGAVLCSLHPSRPSMLLQHLPALPAKIVNCSGAGDCLVAGCLFGLSRGCSPLQALGYGVAASKSAVESQDNVPSGLSAPQIEAEAAVVLQQASAVELGL